MAITLFVNPAARRIYVLRDPDEPATDLLFCDSDGWRFSSYGTPELRVALAFRDQVVLAPDNKIRLLKAVRNATGCGLKEAKDAVEAAYPECNRPG